MQSRAHDVPRHENVFQHVPLMQVKWKGNAVIVNYSSALVILVLPVSRFSIFGGGYEAHGLPYVTITRLQHLPLYSTVW